TVRSPSKNLTMPALPKRHFPVCQQFLPLLDQIIENNRLGSDFSRTNQSLKLIPTDQPDSTRSIFERHLHAIKKANTKRLLQRIDKPYRRIDRTTRCPSLSHIHLQDQK